MDADYGKTLHVGILTPMILMLALLRGASEPTNNTFDAVPIESTNATDGGVIRSRDPTSLFGSSIASGGDFNGDNVPDLAVGMRALKRTERRTGGVQLLTFDGHQHRWSLNFEAFAPGFENLGCAVKLIHDVNGDGFDELAAVAIRTPPDSAFKGGFAIWYGRSWTVLGGPDWQLGTLSSGFARASPIDSAGDVNGDGFNDLIVGEPRHRKSLADEGSASIYLGSKTGLLSTASWFVPGGSEGMRFGYSVCGAGDVNGDGLDDVMLGAPCYSSETSQSGAAFLYLGARNGLSTKAAWSHRLPADRAWLGATISAAGDINGDGLDDVIVAAPGHFQFRQRNPQWRGKVLLFAGSNSGLGTNHVLSLEGEDYMQAYGQSAIVVGDMDGNGTVEVAVGAPEMTHGDGMKGAVFLYSVSKSFEVESKHVLYSGRSEDFLGWSLAGGKDLNRDGYPDLVASAVFGGESNERGGIVRILWGGSNCLTHTDSPWRIRDSIHTAHSSSPVASNGVFTPLPVVDPSSTSPRRNYWAPFGAAVASIAAAVVLIRRRRAMIHANTLAAERFRIARELHDDVGSRLAEIALITGLDKHQSLDAAQLKERIQQIHDVARTTAHSIKELVWDLNHTHATAEELAGALTDYVERVLQLAGVSVQIEMQDDWPKVELPPATRHASFMVVKESIHNLIKHSRATHATFTMRLRQGEFSLRIRDNGIGFDPHLSTTSGHGLPGMRQRARETGGSLECLASPGQGTEIRLSYKIDSSS